MLIAAACLVVTWVPLTIGVVFDVYPLYYAGVLSAYVGLSWLLPATFIGIAARDWAEAQRLDPPAVIGALVAVAACVVLISGVAALTAAYELTHY